MALITCPECQTEVSSFAKACPKCAYPMAPPSQAQEPHSDYAVQAEAEQQALRVKRAGAPWEMAGTATCILGIIVMVASPSAGGALLLIGLTVFIIGRFN